MSTILKALRRLEEDGTDQSKSSDPSKEIREEAEAEAATTSLAADASLSAQEAEAPPPTRRAPAEPRATDDLRERILAEERASELTRSDRPPSARLARDEMPTASASIAGTLTSAPSDSLPPPPTLDPFANRVVEPAFTPPSSASLEGRHAGFDSDSVAPVSAGVTGFLSRGLMLGALGLGVVGVFLAGFLLSGETESPLREMTVAANETAPPSRVSPQPTPTPVRTPAPTPSVPSVPSVPSTPSISRLETDSETAFEVLPTPSAAAQPEEVASLSAPSAEGAAVPVRPMTVASTETATLAAAPIEAPKAEVEAEKSSALARAAVTPTPAVREAAREPIQQAAKAAVDPMIASRPRPQTFPGERARVSAAAPSDALLPADSIQVAEVARETSVKVLPLAEIAPPRSERRIAEASSPTPSNRSSTPSQTPFARSSTLLPSERVLSEAPVRAGSVRPSERPDPTIVNAASAPVIDTNPNVELVDRRGLPDLTVIRTSWHPSSDRRSAKIRLEEENELVTLREGDAVGGMTIYEISPSAVVFTAGEVQIRRRVGEAASGR